MRREGPRDPKVLDPKGSSATGHLRETSQTIVVVPVAVVEPAEVRPPLVTEPRQAEDIPVAAPIPPDGAGEDQDLPPKFDRDQILPSKERFSLPLTSEQTEFPGGLLTAAQHLLAVDVVLTLVEEGGETQFVGVRRERRTFNFESPAVPGLVEVEHVARFELNDIRFELVHCRHSLSLH